MIKAVIFDIGGVVVNYDKGVYGRVVEGFGHSRESFISKTRWHYDMAQKGKISYLDYWTRNARKMGLSNEDAIAAHSAIAKGMENRNRINKETVKIIKALKGYKTACLSNVIDEHYDHNAKIGVYKLFDVVVSSNRVGMAKPYKNIYRHTLKLLMVKPSEAVFIDDKEEFVRPARELGIHAILFRDAKQLRSELKKLRVL